jgi:hypothetical protein
VANSERNSYYAAKQGIDGASIRSGLVGHGRTDSINGSITGMATSPLASPREATMPELASRRSSDCRDPENQNDENEIEPVKGASKEDHGKARAEKDLRSEKD